MSFRLTVGLFHVLEVMFFTGIAGCALVVVTSWISIFKSGFSDKDEPFIDSHEEFPSHRRRS